MIVVQPDLYMNLYVNLACTQDLRYPRPQAQSPNLFNVCEKRGGAWCTKTHE